MDHLKETKKSLDAVSPSFCLAKWLQVTIHLQNGLTHSCHHPSPHKIPLDEIALDPGALHNTKFKKLQRKKMLQGERPQECDYCWNIEDTSPNQFSDRAIKSAATWAAPHFNAVATTTGEENVLPTYVEVSFGHECQFRCAYCSPTISSAILAEYQKFGAYSSTSYFAIDKLKEDQVYPYSKSEVNPYVEAFWKWWPDLVKNLETFRITGGEPLLHPSTYLFLEKIIESPRPSLNVAINSNLGVPDLHLEKFLSLSKKIVDGKMVKTFEIFTSIDTDGEQAEYIRNGLDVEKFYLNLNRVLEELPSVHVIIMCTFNAMSVPRFANFIKQVAIIKKKYPNWDGSGSRLQLDISYLRHPAFMAANILPLSFLPYVEKALDCMLRSSQFGEMTIFRDYEIAKLRRLLDWLRSDTLDPESKLRMQSAFLGFFDEYDQRKGVSLSETFPEFSTLISEIRDRTVYGN